MKRLARFLLFLLLVLVLLAGFVFTLNNTTVVPLWLGTDLDPKPLSVWFLLAFSAGGLLGLLLGLGLWRSVRHRLELRQLRARIRQLEQEAAMSRHTAAHERSVDGN